MWGRSTYPLKTAETLRHHICPPHRWYAAIFSDFADTGSLRDDKKSEPRALRQNPGHLAGGARTPFRWQPSCFCLATKRQPPGSRWQPSCFAVLGVPVALPPRNAMRRNHAMFSCANAHSGTPGAPQGADRGDHREWQFFSRIVPNIILNRHRSELQAFALEF